MAGGSFLTANPSLPDVNILRTQVMSGESRMDESGHGEERCRRVTFATIRRSGQVSLLEGTLIEDIKRAIHPTNKVQRYRRVWRVSKMVRIADSDFFGGKLGFSSVRSEEQVTYDEKRGDFISHVSQSEQCVFSHFVVHSGNSAEEAWLLFEERPPDIKRQSFIGAMQSMFDNSDTSLKVSVDRIPVKFGEWLKRVERVTEFTGQAHVPNPGYKRRAEKLEAILEETRAESVKLTAKAPPSGPGLDVENSVLDAFVGHAESRDGQYGRYSARAESEGDKVEYRDGMSDAVDHVPETPGEDSMSIWRKLVRKMKEAAGRQGYGAGVPVRSEVEEAD